jgi:hypothetical protein
MPRNAKSAGEAADDVITIVHLFEAVLPGFAPVLSSLQVSKRCDKEGVHCCPLSWLPLPKSVRQQIRETYESFPACGSASQTSIETRIEDQGLSCGIANCPKIPHRIAAQERLRKVPNFARKGELPDEVM